MDRLRGWFGRSGRASGEPTTPAQQSTTLDLNASDAASSSGGDPTSSAAAAATDAAMQATAAAAAAAAGDANPSSSSQASTSSSSSTADAGAGPPPEASTSQPEEPEDVNPMLQTSLTKRFRGKIQPLNMPSYESMMQEDFMNNCAVRSVIAGTMGGALGVAFGVFTASLDTQGIDTAPLGETKPTRVVLRETWVLMKEKSKSYAKGFAGMGFLYSGTECMIERYRAKHDAVNATLAGCATGGLMAAPGGAKAMCFGCASFAAFSTAIEYFTGGM